MNAATLWPASEDQSTGLFSPFLVLDLAPLACERPCDHVLIIQGSSAGLSCEFRQRPITATLPSCCEEALEGRQDAAGGNAVGVAHLDGLRPTGPSNDAAPGGNARARGTH